VQAFSVFLCILGFSWLGVSPMMVPLLRDGGFWKRFPVMVQPVGAGGSASLRIWPPGNKSRDAPNQQDSFHWLGPVYNQGYTEASLSIARFVFQAMLKLCWRWLLPASPTASKQLNLVRNSQILTLSPSSSGQRGRCFSFQRLLPSTNHNLAWTTINTGKAT